MAALRFVYVIEDAMKMITKIQLRKAQGMLFSWEYLFSNDWAFSSHNPRKFYPKNLGMRTVNPLHLFSDPTHRHERQVTYQELIDDVRHT